MYKKRSHKKPTFKDFKNCLEATRIKSKIKHPEKMKLTQIVLRKIIKDLKAKGIVFTEKTNKIALSTSDNKRTESVDLIEAYAYGTSKVLY